MQSPSGNPSAQREEPRAGNAGWQRDLSVSHNKIGDVQRAQGDLAAALTSYRVGFGQPLSDRD
jgi:hypothetical protein